MKIIDLLNKIANGEEPQKIKYNNVEFVYGAFTMEGDFLEGLDGKSYNGEKSGYWSKEQNGWFEYYIDFDSLNDEVEILKEEKKIPEKIDLYEETQNIIRENNYKLVYHDIHKCIVSLECKYNQLLDYLKSKGE